MSSQKIRDRIRALLAKTSSRGCTEAEAMAAADKAAALMKEHGLSEVELQMDEQRSRSRSGGGAQKARLWPIIAHCTNTAVTIVDTDGGIVVSFVGREPGPTIADYLRQVCDRAVDREVAVFKTQPLYRRKRLLSVKRQVVAAFTGAMVNRLSRRMMETFGPSVSKQARIEAQEARDRIYTGTSKVALANQEERHFEAWEKGYQAGNKVTLTHGVNGAPTPTRMIGGAS